MGGLLVRYVDQDRKPIQHQTVVASAFGRSETADQGTQARQTTSASEDVSTAATPERTLDREERRISARRGSRGHCAADHRRFTGADSPVMLAAAIVVQIG